MEGPDGRLTAKAAVKPRKIHVLCSSSNGLMSKVPADRPSAMTATSMRSDPAIVYDDELDRHADPAGPAPDADEDVERDQHRLPEDVEEEEVVRGENPDDRAFEEEQEAEVGREPLPPGPEAVPDCGRADDHSQADEPEREVLQADVVGDTEVLEPHDVRLVLEPPPGESRSSPSFRSRGRAPRGRRGAPGPRRRGGARA